MAELVTIDSPLWTDYVMGQLEESEKAKSFPKCAGLRRVFENLLNIKALQYKTDIIQYPTKDFSGCTAVHTIIYQDDKKQLFTITGSSQANTANVDTNFQRYLVEMAETRAEGRCLRRILRLQIAVAEEISDIQTMAEPNAVINDSQINLIDIMCANSNRGLNINKAKLLKQEFKIDDVSELSKTQAGQLIKTLSEYQQDSTKIPAKIKN